MARAGMILLNENQIALIKRLRNGQCYFILPGGQVEEEESLRTALMREAMEELGVEIETEQLVAVVSFHDKPQYYFRVKITGGTFGYGTGPEMAGLYPPEFGTYEAIWMSVDQLRHHDIRPTPLISLIEDANLGKWPEQPLYLYEEDHS